ncbi:heterokaryon incompatibility [Fusarium beomiforme]|uniref:Heterokaryon incompatibility n=1 Tax=Fusarium beomiforme TaxID=44412 RepID=A0A9P5AE20_9HYPO|nr:heterokaryon incompatibility [Fusarium beomiforme]
MLRGSYKRPRASLLPMGLGLSVALTGEATDPRDLVYGLLGITHAEIPVDYNKPVWEVYFDWVQWELSNRELGSKPSSVVPFPLQALGCIRKKSKRMSTRHHLGSHVFQHLISNAKPAPPWKTSILEYFGKGQFHTVRFDQVPGDVAASMTKRSITSLEKVCLYTVFMMAEGDAKQKYPPLVSLFDIFTIGERQDAEEKLNVQPNSLTAQAFLSVFDRRNDLFDLRRHNGISTSEEYSLWLDARRSMSMFQDKEIYERAHYMESTVSTINDLEEGNKSLFRTLDGLVGKGQPGAQAGDKLCVLEYSEIAVILRPDGDSWRLVGTCFVSGLSKCEVAEHIESGRLQCQDFLII